MQGDFLKIGGPRVWTRLKAAMASTNKSFGVNEQILGQDQSDQVVAVRPTNSVGSLLQRRRCAPSHLGGGDDPVSGTDDDRHDDISHNGSSEFGGNLIVLTRLN